MEQKYYTFYDDHLPVSVLRILNEYEAQDRRAEASFKAPNAKLSSLFKDMARLSSVHAEEISERNGRIYVSGSAQDLRMIGADPRVEGLLVPALRLSA